VSEDYGFGVLFVQGIGDQQQKSALARFGGRCTAGCGGGTGIDPRKPVRDVAKVAPESMVGVTDVRRRTRTVTFRPPPPS
jgi:hypothetical protein